MTDDEFGSHLRSLLCGVDRGKDLQPIMPTVSLEEMTNYLDTAFRRLQVVKSQLLKSYLKFGQNLSLAKERFVSEKEKKRVTGTWEQWLTSKTKISASYARKIIQAKALLLKYPLLQNLSLTFKELLQLRRKIDVFTRNEWRVRVELKSSPRARVLES